MVAHWVETGAVVAVHAGCTPCWAARPDGREPVEPAAVDLLAEREVWRVEAGRGMSAQPAAGRGVFDLVFDWADGSWRLTRCLD